MSKRAKILPSLLSANFLKLQDDILLCESANCDMLHLDVMDGRFTPNITFGQAIAKSIKSATKLPIDCHLMIVEPEKYIEEFASLGADYISIHVEAASHLHRQLTTIKSLGAKAGIALNPATPIEYALSAAEYSDFILLMSVNPGFGGQSFIKSFYKRCETLKNFLIREGLEKVEIEVDGGVKIENCAEIANAGADLLVCGSGLFSGDLKENCKRMRLNLESI